MKETELTSRTFCRHQHNLPTQLGKASWALLWKGLRALGHLLRNSWVVWWTLFSSLVLLYIAVFTPYEVAFMSPATEASDPLFVLGRIVDLVFALDMMLQFFLLVPKAGGSAGDLETGWGYIVRSYLRGWFILDFVSLAASAFDIIPVFSHVERNSNERVTSIMTSFRIVRILRLIKLVRLLRASRRLKDWLTKVPTPRATLTTKTLIAAATLTALSGREAYVLTR